MFIEEVDGDLALSEIRDFLIVAGNALETFRYFSARKPEDAIADHLITLIGTTPHIPVAYGHLRADAYDGYVWLGVCVAENFQDAGLGTQIVQRLLDFADERDVQVSLTVDVDNERAQRFYERFGFERRRTVEVLGRPAFVVMRRNSQPWRVKVADTLGSLVDKLATVNNKMFVNQELLYEIRRMTFDEYKAKYFASEDGAKQLWETLKKACDLNVQRNAVISEIDQKVVEIAKAAAEGKELDNGSFVQRPHKTY